MNYSRNQKGIALIVTLLALALITAMVVEFAYGVYTGTNNLYNWRDSQRLSLMARSGVNVSAKYIADFAEKIKLTEPMEFPVENPFEDFQGTITVRIEDEHAKFNLNALVFKTGDPNNDIIDAFKRLLDVLSLDKKIADRIVDWIDSNSEARLPDSETEAKNSVLNSVDELLLIKGITREDYSKLLPYINVNEEERTHLFINVNAAQKPVLMSLSKDLDEKKAELIINERKIEPFDEKKNIYSIVGSIDLSSQITLINNGKIFSITSTASSSGIKRIIETVFDTDKEKIEYWKEY
jgi:general secretion pathway protein K